jgi:hypothetical protein
MIYKEFTFDSIKPVSSDTKAETFGLLISIEDKGEGLQITIERDSGRFIASFGYSIYYEIYTETVALSFLDKLSELIGENDNYIVYRINNSSFVQDVIESSYDMYSKSNLKHYLVLTQDDIMHIVTADEVKIEFI